MEQNEAIINEIFKQISRLSYPGRQFLCGPGRQPSLAAGRALAAALMHDVAGMTWQQTAAVLGDRSHATLLELVDRYQAKPRWRSDLAALSETLRLKFQTATPTHAAAGGDA